jgi:hypothetical protein
MSVFGYCAKYDFNKDKNTILAQYNPLHPFEKFSIGIVGRASRRLTLLAEMKGD